MTNYGDFDLIKLLELFITRQYKLFSPAYSYF